MKTIDEKFAEIGFKKTYESELRVVYEKETQFGYIHCLDIGYKKSGEHIVHSFRKKQKSSDYCADGESVGMTVKEMRLCIKKMRKLGWKQND